ncbi:hypothetical protein KWG64_06355 [Rahnella sp. PD12R]|uniref:hypothetical protein n=1 Tax=Rahnella sp. PD12R TaxID=2855688 RepID=UPI001C48D382|nr:hypothetical protein [Rahnella sp. PD12R]MBV6817562.1 hypothetical protein [Rahnella sp. PD12R]
MAKLTAKEKKWVAEVQAVLNRCPSNRIGFATIGDPNVTLFDVTRYKEICAELDKGGRDFIPCSDRVGATFDETLDFPNSVESTAG